MDGVSSYDGGFVRGLIQVGVLVLPLGAVLKLFGNGGTFDSAVRTAAGVLGLAAGMCVAWMVCREVAGATGGPADAVRTGTVVPW